jgi:hypothetical protein
MLSPKLLEALREYWRGLKRKPLAESSERPSFAKQSQQVICFQC